MFKKVARSNRHVQSIYFRAAGVCEGDKTPSRDLINSHQKMSDLSDFLTSKARFFVKLCFTKNVALPFLNQSLRL